MSKACRLRGPNYAVGDIDWTCREHGDTVYMRNLDRWGAPDIRREEMFCTTGEPELVTPEYEAELERLIRGPVPPFPVSNLFPKVKVARGGIHFGYDPNPNSLVGQTVTLTLRTEDPMDPFTKKASTPAIHRRMAELRGRLKDGCLCDEHPCEHADWQHELDRLQTELVRRGVTMGKESAMKPKKIRRRIDVIDGRLEEIRRELTRSARSSMSSVGPERDERVKLRAESTTLRNERAALRVALREKELAKSDNGRESELEAELAQVRGQLDECRRENRQLDPVEPGPGSFVRFSVVYQIPGRAYTYGAMRVGNLWYVTGDGILGFKKGTWSELCRAYRGADIGIDAYKGGALEFEVGAFGEKA